MDLLEPKPIEIEGGSYTLSKFPAIVGREIISQYLTTGLPKIGDYKMNEALMEKLMAYVAVEVNGKPMRLTNSTLINNHVKSWEILARLEIAMIEYNCSFFQDGRASTLLRDFAQKLTGLNTKILTDSLARLFGKEKQPSTN